MGSIPEYQRKQFASSYVGGAQRDESAALAIGAVQDELVEPIRKNEIAKLKAREEAQTDAIADNALISYSLSAQSQMADLETAYASNPKAYPNAVQTMLQELADISAKALPDARVRAKFLGAVSTVRKQAIKPSFTWQEQQQAANTVTAVEDSTRTIALTAMSATDIPAFEQNTGALGEKIEELAKLQNITDPNEIKKLKVDADAKVVEAFLWNVLDKNPERMFDILAAKELKVHPGFTADISGKFKVRANNKILKQKKDLVEAQRLTYENLRTEAFKHTLTTDTINERFASKDPLLNINKKQFNDLQIMILPAIRAEANAVAKDHPIAEKYLKLINSLVSDNITRGRFQQELASVWRDGVVMPEEASTWDALVQGLTTLDGIRRHQQFVGPAKSISAFAKEVYNYRPKIEQVKATAAAMRSFMNTWIGNSNSGKTNDQVVQETIANIQKANNPDRNQYQIGDIVPDPVTGKQWKVLGYFPNGDPDVEEVK